MPSTNDNNEEDFSFANAASGGSESQPEAAGPVEEEPQPAAATEPVSVPVEEPEQFPEDPVIGDGVISFPSSNEDSDMPQADLPEAVAGQLMTESVGNIQANNRDGRNISTLAAGVLQGAMARNFDELGTLESRANSGVIATPIASPTTQAARA